MTRRIQGRYLGLRKYEPVLALQRELLAARQRGEIDDTVLFVEHEPVITLGRGTRPGHLLVTAESLNELGVDLVPVERGGDVTLHAPGQLVCYPIVELKPDRCDVRRYVNDLTECMRRILADVGIDAGAFSGQVGLWLDRRALHHWPGAASALDLAKIGAIGVRISRWTTMHGFALNLSTDLRWFSLIVPCGISEYPVTTVAELLGHAPTVASVVPRAFEYLVDLLGADAIGLVDESRTETGAHEAP